MTETLIIPKILNFNNIENSQELEVYKTPAASFLSNVSAKFCGKGSWVLLDFGKELSGGVRIIVVGAKGGEKLHIRFGESVSEAMADLGFKNAGNDHSPRDMVVTVSNLSDLTFGQTGFRFAYVELMDESAVSIRNIFAVNRLPHFENERRLTTKDALLNEIINTAAYTLKLCCQNGYIWDGIKRDRLVWCGDLHQEILTAFYLFGDIPNITASLDFLRAETKADSWMNNIPAYSAWWVVCLCDYYTLSKNSAYFNENYSYATQITEKINCCISDDGEMSFGNSEEIMEFFLDWPTYQTNDAIIGTAALMVFMAKKLNGIKRDKSCEEIIKKLSPYLYAPCETKQVKAFQILAGGDKTNAAKLLEKNGAEGFSTFMAYYILKADIQSGGKNTLNIIKSYFGGMLSRGATTFWEDFDLEWLKNSGRIDELPAASQKDIHGDFGRFCYKNFRHSLCHGWSSGVYAFLYEHFNELGL